MKHLFDSGILNKIDYGVKLLGNGSNKLAALSTAMQAPIRIEVSDATQGAIDAISATGGSVSMLYRTPLLMRQYLKPHKFPEYQDLKSPMPSPKKVKKLEKLREKGIEVTYSDAPWFTYNKEAIAAEEVERERRIAEAQHAELLPSLPADRSEGVGAERARIQRKQLYRTHKYI